jgi:probable rRNA maturation factor
VPSVYTVVVLNRQRSKKIDVGRVRQITETLFGELEIQSAELGIHLVGAHKMAQVNWQFLRHEGSTDVITFDYSELRAAGDGGVRRVQGELFISVDDAVQQAAEFKTTWRSEVVRYVVHGVLHLLGYDDLQPEPRRQMKRAENRLVRQLERVFPVARL